MSILQLGGQFSDLFNRFARTVLQFIRPRTLVAVLHIEEYRGTTRNIKIDAVLVREVSPESSEEEQIMSLEQDLIDMVNAELGHRGLEEQYEIGVEVVDGSLPEETKVDITHEKVKK